MKTPWIIVTVLVLNLFPLLCISQNEKEKEINNTFIAKGYQIDQLLFEDDFNKDLSNWKIETDTTRNAQVNITKGSLVIDADCGVTVWLNKNLSGNILIEYDRKVLVQGNPNDRLSDLNQFWMASDPLSHNLFTRSGVFSQYHNLQMYYFGIGGNTNTTSRMRKYLGTGERYLINDLSDSSFLLEPNMKYHVKTIVYKGFIKVFINDVLYFSYQDSTPCIQGYFGLRTTQSRQEIDNIKIYSLK